MLNKKWVFFIILLYSITSLSTSLAANLKGKIKFEEQSEGTTPTVSINNVKANFSGGVNYSVHIPDDRLYRINITANGYYPSYQTFSHHELKNLSSANTSENFRLPEITLVKRKDNRVMLAFAGDVMMGRRYSKPYFGDPVLINKDVINKKAIRVDTKNLLQHMKPYMELADYSAVNLETQIARDKPKQRAPKSVTFFSPPETLDALQWAGIDYVTLGNNHIFDYLDEGLASTLNFLDQSNLTYSGGGINEQQALKPHYANILDSTYAMLGFVGWKGRVQPNQVAEFSKGGAAFGTEENIIDTVTSASNEGYPTIVQYHGSLEYSDEPSPMTESRLKTAIDHGADLAIAHHPHVTQGFEIYKGKLIAYSMGNFLFDQYFHAPPLSYVLYVWMDGEQFHRAEIVPIYLKGYVPVPATGIQRNALTKRTQTLSHRRGINFNRSGGHLILLNKENQSEQFNQDIRFTEDETIKNIYHFPVTGRIIGLTSKYKNLTYRLGENLLNGGDFETYDLFTSNERSWLLNSATLSKAKAHRGQNSIAIRINNDKNSMIGMQTFRRVFNYANPMTYQAKILNSQSTINAKLIIQFRGKKEKFFDALDGGEKVILKEFVLGPKTKWQNLQINFNTPRVGYKSYRILLELSSTKKSKQPLIAYIDDISLIQWQPHQNNINEIRDESTMSGLATHIELLAPDGEDKNITIIYDQ